MRRFRLANSRHLLLPITFNRISLTIGYIGIEHDFNFLAAKPVAGSAAPIDYLPRLQRLRSIDAAEPQLRDAPEEMQQIRCIVSNRRYRTIDAEARIELAARLAGIIGTIVLNSYVDEFAEVPVGLREKFSMSLAASTTCW